jgi:F-type H+-transporting ATPase subunit alpha
MDNNSISSKVKLIEDSLHQELNNLFKIKTSDDTDKDKVGYVDNCADGVCHIIGLDNVRIGQKLSFKDSWDRAKKIENENEPEISGLVVDLDGDSIGTIIFGEERFIKQGDRVTIAEAIFQIPVTEKMLGRVISPFGNPIDKKPFGEHPEWFDENNKVKDGILCLPIERKAPGVIDRSKINEPIQTGITSIDSMLPIGRGQRMLVIGDRATGKTAVGMDAIVNQNRINRDLEGNKSQSFDIYNVETHDPRTVYCIYVAIGRKASEIKQLFTQLDSKKAMEYTIILSAMANDPASLLYIAPFSGTTVGEYFRDKGKHALIIYDDLSKHATAYRQISLLLRRPPGREAFPGDIFYLHSRLLERSSKITGKQNTQLTNKDITFDYTLALKPFKEKDIQTYGGGSLTALPLIETKQNDYASYIPTNVISITDGQVYLSDKLFNEGFRPPINIGISVSRVGSKAQIPSMKEVSDGLKGYLANYREKEKYTKFGINPTKEDLVVLDRGRRIIHFLKQDRYKPIPIERQIIGLFAVRKGYFDILPDNEKFIKDFEEHIWESISKDTTLGKIVSELKEPKVKISSLQLSDGSKFIMQLDKKIQELQLEFLKNKKFKDIDIEIVGIINLSLDKMQEKFKKDFEEHMDSLFKDITIDSEQIKRHFINTFDSIDASLRIRPFSKMEKVPPEIDINTYMDNISNKIFFQYFVEEKQKLKNEFLKECSKNFNEQLNPDKSEEVKAFAEEFLNVHTIDKEGKITRYKRTCDKRDDFVRNYIDKQITEIQKIKNDLERQNKSVADNQDQANVGVFQLHYSSLKTELESFHDKLKTIVKDKKLSISE